MAWQDLFVALSLVMIIEGIWPFISPNGFRRSLLNLSQLDARTIRIGGLLTMVAGLITLYLVR